MLVFRGRRRAGALAAALSILPTRGSAQEPPPDAIRLDWSAPAGCPGAAEVRARVDQLLGGPPPPSSAKREVARAVVSADASGRWRLDLRTETAGTAGRRELTATSCRELADAAALIVALAFDPEAVARTRDAPAPTAPATSIPATSVPAVTVPMVTAPSVVTGPPPPPEPLAPPPATAASDPPAQPRAALVPATDRATRRPRPTAPDDLVEVLAGASLSSDIGAMPEPALGFTASIGLGNRLGRVELAGTYWLEQHGAAPARPSVGGDFSFVSAAAQVCPTLVRGVVELAGCGGLELGRMHAVGTGVRHPGDNTLVWVAARAGAAGSWRLDPHLAMKLELGAAVPFLRPRWVLGAGTLEEVDRPAPVDARASLGGEVLF